MIVEVIGCAGAGKTTLARMLCERGVTASPVRMLPDLVRDRAILRRVTHPTAVNVLQELGSFPFFVGGWPSERDFVAYARRVLARRARSRYDYLNGMRGIVRKVGMYRLASSRAQDSIVLSDEGTLLSAYNLFALTTLDLEPRDVETFLRLVPLPERVVYVTAPVPSLVARAGLRPTPRRQHRGRTATEIESDVRRAVELFDRIAASPTVAERLLVVENADADESGRRRHVEEIARWLGSPVPRQLSALPLELSVPESRA